LKPRTATSWWNCSQGGAGHGRDFLRYVDDGHFDGTIFHRIVPGFCIQGGGLTPTSPARKRAPISNEPGTG